MSKKQKVLWSAVKRAFVLFFILLVIGSFVVSLAYSPWSSRGGDMSGYRVAKIKNETYYYMPNTPYYYLYSIIRKNMSETMKGDVDENLLSQYALARSVSTLLESATIYQFAEENGVKPSQDAIRRIIETTTRSYLYKAPDQGLLDFAAIQYDFNSLEGSSGDIMNSVSIPTYAELYNFYEMENYTHTAEFIYLDITNYISGKLSQDDIQGFYDDNYGRYVNELTIDELSTTSHSLAYSISDDAKTLGWEKTVDKYKSRANYINTIALKDTHGTSTRYAAALKMKKGGISQKPVFENREYHIIKLAGYQPYRSIKPENQKTVLLDFIHSKFSDLRAKFDPDIKNSVMKAEAYLKTSSDLKKASSLSGFSYLISYKISPMSSVIIDEKGNQVPFPALENQDLMDFLFKSNAGSISRTFSTENYIVIARLVKKAPAANLDYRNLGSEFRPYQRYKSIIAMQDWFNSVELRYPHIVYTNEITNLQKILKKE